MLGSCLAFAPCAFARTVETVRVLSEAGIWVDVMITANRLNLREMPAVDSDTDADGDVDGDGDADGDIGTDGDIDAEDNCSEIDCECFICMDYGDFPPDEK